MHSEVAGPYSRSRWPSVWSRRGPLRDISVGLTVTNGKAAAATDINYSQRLFNSITDYLTPGNPVTFQG